MILLDRNNQPKNTVYYLSAVIYGYLKKNGSIGLIDLYKRISNKVLKRKLNFEFFSLAVDFLFLIDKVDVNNKGDIYVYKKDKDNKKQE